MQIGHGKNVPSSSEGVLSLVELIGPVDFRRAFSNEIVVALDPSSGFHIPSQPMCIQWAFLLKMSLEWALGLSYHKAYLILCKHRSRAVLHEKSYHNINWEFLLYLLGCLGFGSKWRKWMSTSISMTCFSIMINGGPHGFFGSSWGLRQGDLPSPLLFVIVIEALNRMLSRALLVVTYQDF